MASTKGVEVWNERCMKVIDDCEEKGLRLMGEGKDAEAIAGMQLAEELVACRAALDALVCSSAIVKIRPDCPPGDLDRFMTALRKARSVLAG